MNAKTVVELAERADVGCVCGRCGDADYDGCCCLARKASKIFWIYAKARQRGDHKAAVAAVDAMAHYHFAGIGLEECTVRAAGPDSIWIRPFVREVRLLTRDWMTVRELSQAFGLTERHVRRLAEQGEITGHKGPADLWLIDVDASIEALERRSRSCPHCGRRKA